MQNELIHYRGDSVERDPWDQEILIVISEILLDQLSINNTKQKKFFIGTRENGLLYKIFCYIRSLYSEFPLYYHQYIDLRFISLFYRFQLPHQWCDSNRPISSPRRYLRQLPLRLRHRHPMLMASRGSLLIFPHHQPRGLRPRKQLRLPLRWIRSQSRRSGLAHSRAHWFRFEHNLLFWQPGVFVLCVGLLHFDCRVQAECDCPIIWL